MDVLINKGIELIEPKENPIKGSGSGRHIVIVGPARGGTSLVAGALHHLGVFMGRKAHAPVFEDVELASAIEGGDHEAARRLVKANDEEHAVWAFKRPWLTERLELAEDLFNRPKYIFVYRDLLSIAKRNAISMGSEVLPSMQQALHQYSHMLDFIARSRPSSMLVSYEKALRYPKDFISSLVTFCDLSPSEQQIHSAIKFIEPEPAAYLDASRLNKTQGRLSGIRNGQVFGWARYLHRKRPAKVHIFVNDELVGTSTADRPRKDLEDRFKKPCAFTFPLPEGFRLNPGDVLRARVADDVFDLKNSPLVYKGG